jgi:glycerol-3-phosphate dehydrogenase (NAD(P)+)
MKKIAVIGAGAWGTALALLLSRSGRAVMLYSRNEQVVEAVNLEGRNETYLPGCALPKNLKATVSLQEVIDSDALVLVSPAQFLRETCIKLRDAGVPAAMPLLLCCKGIETGTLKLMSEVVAEVLPECRVAVLSGPNFADEVAKGLPAATTIACEDPLLGQVLVQLFCDTAFRPYYSPDNIGAQIGGAVKNVLAIGCGILAGRGLGENAKAALMTRGLAEIVRLGMAKGGKMETLMGLSGIGDLILTCSSTKSRNMSLGMYLGQGGDLETLLSARQNITEGVASAASVTALARQLGIEMPICEAVYNVLYNKVAVETVIQGLLQRPLTSELN